MSIDKYLNMQKTNYEAGGKKWTPTDRDPVVGWFDAHNTWPDYDTFLFKDFDTSKLVALEYGCGPGRNIVKFNNRFKRIDGVDISSSCIEAAKVHIQQSGMALPNLYVCDGKSIPVENETYDVVFSVICLQHICVYDIRKSILTEIHRVLKPGGYFCFQMGYGGSKGRFSGYYENSTDAKGTNGKHDVSVMDQEDLKKDLIADLNFKNFQSDIRARGPGDRHANWIWVQVQK